MALAIENQQAATAVEIGGLPIALRSENPEFIRMVEGRYGSFVCAPEHATSEFQIAVAPPSSGMAADDELEVRRIDGQWVMRRGDFVARWNPRTRRGLVRCGLYPYAIDAVLRIVHSLVLAEETDGFLLHSASAIRNGRAFLFSGLSGAGKTTIARLAPPDVTLLSDEISYIRKSGAAYRAFGTPFAGELGIAGERVSAPLAAIYFLEQGAENRIRPMPAAVAVRKLLRNVLFFAEDDELVENLFDLGCEFISAIEPFELTFRPERRVWELIE